MKQKFVIFFNMSYRVIFILFFLLSQTVTGKNNENKLWYKQPAGKWIESLPVGNGRLGAVRFGGIQQEKIGLNISTLWSGEPCTNNIKKTGPDNLNKIREHFFNNEYAEATNLIREHLLGNKENYGTHLPMGNLLINFDINKEKVTNYSRELNIENAVSSVNYSHDGAKYTREVLASNPDDVILIRLTSSQNKSLAAKMHFVSEGIPCNTMKISDNIFGIEGDAFESVHSDGKSGVHFFTALQVTKYNGEVTVTNEGIEFKDASLVEIRICGYTNYTLKNPKMQALQQIEGLNNQSFQEIKKRHISDYQNLYNRVTLNLGTGQSALPTDERIKNLTLSGNDPRLYALFYNYARYLLIAGSRENSPVPVNLQGIWNDNFACNMPWTCDFHLDINTQQNYWLTESGNLSECHEPLFGLIEGLVEPGTVTAKDLYGCPGWIAHVFTNAWGYTAPGWGMGWGLHVTGGIWIASHLWHHYEYTLDKDYLRNRAYPVLKKAALFYDSYLVEHPRYGYLVSGPSVSPENKYLTPSGEGFSESMGTVCDAVLIRDLFNYCIKASTILKSDNEFRARLEEKVKHLQPLMIGKYGQLQEWLEDYEEAVPNHRHTSHLIALYPSSQITPYETPELSDAAKISIERRLNQPDWEDVEWSRGNNVNFYARLLEPEEALKHLHGLIKENSSISMLTYSRGGIAGAAQDIFSIDGNYAGGTGISEMLVQSYDDQIYLLPALPKSWADGEFNGVCTRNGFEISFKWENGELIHAKILSKHGQMCHIHYNGLHKSFKTKKGKYYMIDKNMKVM